MPTAELAKQADAVRADIAKLEADLKALLNTIGGAVGAICGAPALAGLPVAAAGSAAAGTLVAAHLGAYGFVSSDCLVSCSITCGFYPDAF